jgi:FkbM family methyltransferase
MDYKMKILALKMVPGLLRRHIVFKRYRHEVEHTGEPELQELRKLVKHGDLALDIGCNLGTYTYELARLTGRVVAFEPNPALASFVRSVATKGTEVQQVALSFEDGTAELSIPTDPERGHGWASVRDGFVTGDVEKISVVTRRLDSIDLPPVSFIKIDVEGFEEQVLDGAERTIARDLPVLLIEIDQADLERIAKRLGAMGYEGAFFQHGMWRPLSEFDADRFQNMTDWHEAMKQSPTRRELEFINNFLFMPPHRLISELN